MAQVITGIVQEVIKKPVSGGRTGYDLVVAGETYGVGLYPPKCKEGDYIKFDLDESRGYKNVARNTLKVSAGKPPAEVVAASTAAPKPAAAGSREDSIMRQSSMNYAIQWIGAMATAGALAVPTTKGKGQEYMDTLRKKYTQEFYEANAGIVYKDISPNPSPAEDAGEEEVPEDDTPADGEWK